MDAAERTKVEEMRARLLVPKIGKWGQLQEWMVDRDDPKNQHRHVSHLWAVFPGRQISPRTTPELAKAAVSLDARGDGGTGWSRSWKVSYWARLLDGDHAYKLLRNQLHLLSDGSPAGEVGGVYANLLDACPPFQIDGNFGATAGMAEMLLQSQRSGPRRAERAGWRSGARRSACRCPLAAAWSWMVISPPSAGEQNVEFAFALASGRARMTFGNRRFQPCSFLPARGLLRSCC